MVPPQSGEESTTACYSTAVTLFADIAIQNGFLPIKVITKLFRLVIWTTPRRIGNEFIGAKTDNPPADDAHFSNEEMKVETPAH